MEPIDLCIYFSYLFAHFRMTKSMLKERWMAYDMWWLLRVKLSCLSLFPRFVSSAICLILIIFSIFLIFSNHLRFLDCPSRSFRISRIYNFRSLYPNNNELFMDIVESPSPRRVDVSPFISSSTNLQAPTTSLLYICSFSHINNTGNITIINKPTYYYLKNEQETTPHNKRETKYVFRYI